MQEERLPDSSFNILPASTHLIWSPHLSDVGWFFYEKQNIMPSFPLETHFSDTSNITGLHCTQELST